MTTLTVVIMVLIFVLGLLIGVLCTYDWAYRQSEKVWKELIEQRQRSDELIERVYNFAVDKGVSL